MSSLETDTIAFDRQLPAMLKTHAGQYVVIKDEVTEQFLDTYEAAVTWADEHFGLSRFFVRKVAEEGDVVHFTRDLPCRP